MANKIIGYVLLFVAVLMIAWGFWQSWEVFTAKRPAPEIFKTRTESTKTANTALPKISGLPAGMEEQLGQVLQGQLANILPVSSIATILNLTAWSIFMAILAVLAGKLGGLGVKLLCSEKEKKENA